jgi:hypothetical protein
MIITGNRNFTPAPEGQHLGVLVDVVDLGEQDTKFGKKFMVKLIYQIDENMEDGKPFIVSGRFNATLADRSSLRKHIEGLRGAKFTKEELDGFDPDTLIGTNGLLNIVHNAGDKGVFANIDAVLPYNPKFGDKLEPREYIRVKDREDFSTNS